VEADPTLGRYRRDVLRGLLFAAAFAGGLAGPIDSRTATAQTAPKVVATIAMIGEPLARIAGGNAVVTSLMGPGIDPHLYRPTRADIAALTRADLVLWNGLDLEAQMADALAKIGTVRPVVAVGEAVAGPALLDDPDGRRDPHVWMDPTLWRAAIGRAVDALCDLDPDNADAYRARFAAYAEELLRLEAYGDRVMGSIPEASRVLVTAHDAFGYFGRRFGIEVHGIQGISTESEAGLKAIEDLVALLVDRRIPSVFVETSVSDRNIRALIEGAAARGWTVRIGGTLYSDAMGEAGTYEGTYLGMIDANLTVIAQALGGGAPEGGMAGRLGR